MEQGGMRVKAGVCAVRQGLRSTLSAILMRVRSGTEQAVRLLSTQVVVVQAKDSLYEEPREESST